MLDVVLIGLAFMVVSTAVGVAVLILLGGYVMSLAEEIVAAVNEVKAGVAAAVADIGGLHERLDAFLAVGDVAAARAALAEVAPTMEALAAAVAIPEDPAPPVEG